MADMQILMGTRLRQQPADGMRDFVATFVEGVGRQPLVKGATETQAAGCTCTI